MLEGLESRQLLAGDPSIIQALPWALEFSKPSGGAVVDRDRSGTGFTYVLDNVGNNEYRRGRLDIRPGVSLLRMSSAGDAWENDNTLVNGVMTGFTASSRTFNISATIKGPITLNNGQGAGIMFGPDINNFVRLALVNRNGNIGVEFVDEQKISSGFRHQLGAQPLVNVGSLTSLSTLQLWISGNPKTGYVNGWVSVNGGSIQQIPAPLILKKAIRTAFFSANAKGGLTVFNSPNANSTLAGFDNFAIRRGLPVVEAPPGGSGNLSVSTLTRLFNDVRGGGFSDTKKITFKNTGSGATTISSISLTGANADQFGLLNLPSGSVAAGGSESFSVGMNATSSTALGIKTASIRIVTGSGSATIPLRGLATAGHGGSNEPSLQRVMDLYTVPISVGDPTPDTFDLPASLATPNDQVDVQRLVKAASGSVTIEPLAVFGVGSDTADTVRFGYYPSGNKDDKVQLLSVRGAGAATQTVNPVVNGTTSFDPGAGTFSLYMQFPSMFPTVVQTPGGTEAYGEDVFNTYDPNTKRKIRVYTLKNSAGAVVPNAYLIAGEDLNAGYDTQDFVAIIRNVKAAPAGPEIGFQNLDGVPYGNRLVFNRIQNPNTTIPNTVHDTATVRVVNSGTGNLSVTGIDLSSQWQLVSGPTSFNLAPGATQDITVRFIATSAGGTANNGVIFGHLAFTTNDPDEANANVELAGFWQRFSENNLEPSLAQVIQMLGYGTTIAGPGQILSNGGRVEKVGDEVLSPYWVRADSSTPITVRQLGAWHTQGDPSALRWHLQGSSTRNTLFISDGPDAQSFLPSQQNSSSPAFATFSPTGAFAFRIDGESSIPSENVQEQPGGGYGHHVRFWVAKDRNGNVIPNTYIMAMDYQGINYDYNDNTYLITNVRPA